MIPHRARRVAPLALLAVCGLAACGTPSPRYDPPPAPALNGQITLNVADTALAGNAPALALRVTQAILAKDPDNADALQRQGDAYFALGQIAEAEVSYRRALIARPGQAAAQLGLGRVELVRDPPAGAATLARLVATDPGNVAATDDLAIARDLMGQHAQAQALYRQALQAAPADVPTQVNLGLSLALGGNSAEAITLLAPLAARPDATSRMRADYAVALAIGGQADAATRVLRGDLSADDASQAVCGYQQLPYAAPTETGGR